MSSSRRERIGEKSRRDWDQDKSHRNKHESSSSSSSYSHHHSRSAKTTEKVKDSRKGIELTRSHLNASLSAAISGTASANRERDGGIRDFPSNTTSYVDSVARQADLDRIEEPGFVPASFKSDVNASRAKKLAAKSSGKDDSTHDKAMFGPLWSSKEIEKNQSGKVDKGVADPSNDAQPNATSRFPLAHERMSENPEVRQQRWLNLFRERRKMAMEGTLALGN